MATFTPSGLGNVLPITVNGVTSPLVTNVTLVSAGTEVSIPLLANTKRFLIMSRTKARLQVAYVAGTSGTTFFTIHPGAFYSEGDISASSLTLYVQSNVAGTVLELISWT